MFFYGRILIFGQDSGMECYSALVIVDLDRVLLKIVFTFLPI